MSMITIIGTVYLVISFVIAFRRIKKAIDYEKFYMSFPIGDMEFLGDPPILFDRVTYIFFPAGIFILIWTKIVRMIDRL